MKRTTKRNGWQIKNNYRTDFVVFSILFSCEFQITHKEKNEQNLKETEWQISDLAIHFN